MKSSQPTIKEGYKQTDVGIIPEDWEVKKLVEIADIATGNTPSTKDITNYGDEYLFVSPTDLGKAKYVFNTEKKLSRKGFNISRKFPQGSILFTCIGSTIGKSAIAPIELTSNQQINAILPNSKFSTGFVFYTLNLFAPKIKSSASEQAVPIINKTAFGETVIPLPPLPEQQAIAGVLSEVDALITSLDQLITKKRNIKQGAMQLLLTGKKRLPGFSGDWEMKRLGEIGDFKNGINKGKDDFGFGFPFVNLMDIFGISKMLPNLKLGLVNASIAERKMYELKKGDVLFVRSSVKPEGVGLTSLITADLENTVYSGFLIRFRDHGKLNFEFKEHCFFEEGFRQRLIDNSTVSANTNINQDALKKLEIKLPPTTEEQNAIAKILNDMGAEIEALEKQRDKYKAIKQGMMQELLTGKTRLV